MALLTHQVQGSYGAYPLESLSWRKEAKLRPSVTSVKILNRRTKRCISLKSCFSLRIGAPHVHGLNGKPLKISAFKGGQRDESVGNASLSKFPKKSVELSFVQEESEEAIDESSDLQNVPLASSSEVNETMAGSLAIQNLFKKWLTMLQTQSPSHVANEILKEEPTLKEYLEAQSETQRAAKNGMWKAMWLLFLALDSTVKIPLIVFIPWYLGVTVYYGADVSKELMPLWVLGPLIVALYVKLLRGLVALYAFCFKQTVRVIKDIPMYSSVAYSYISCGKLREDIRNRLWQPMADIKNLDSKEVLIRKLKELQEWALEKYLDFVESIWPHYCRTIRFLKRANLI